MPRHRNTAKKAYHTEIVAPGGGTRADIDYLTKHLRTDSNDLDQEKILAIMNSGGSGVSRRSRGGATDPEVDAAAAVAANAAGASAWADFYAEAADAEADAPASASGGSGTAAAVAAAATANDDTASREYILPILPRMANPNDAVSAKTTPRKKKSKVMDTTGTYPFVVPGKLAQTGTLDSTVPGRTKRSLTNDYDLEEPTLIPIVISTNGNEEKEDEILETDAYPKFALVATSSTSAHSIAITTSGIAYGWGRNEANQLGLLTGSCPVVGLPTKLVGPWGDVPLVGCAVGKSHSVVIDADGNAWAVGSNKCGQCGVNTSIGDITKFRKCVLAGAVDDDEIVQVSCGEQFTVVLTSRGHIYSAGLSEYGQLGNGETGEYFISANKLGFANATKLERRAVFVQSEVDAGLANAKKGEMSNLPDCGEIVIASVSCGKNHTIAVEAPTTSGHQPRVFSWGCGDYGCLGHGVQEDQYYPRLIAGLRGPLFTSNYPVKAEAGSSCSMIITQQGHVYYMGKHRQVGEATMRPSLIDALANNSHVVTSCSGGAQTVFCTTKNAVTVSWGKGDTGELGYGRGNQKSSAQPKFVEKLDSCLITQVACGYGHTLFLVRDDDEEDKKAVKKLAKLDASQVTF